MASNCPRCLRKLSDTADATEPPVFCMYCGQRLRSSEGLPAPGPAMPDAVDTSGNETGAYIPEAVPAEPTQAPLKVIGGYRLLRFIGAGGMGAVYEAEHEKNGQRVAVKLLSGRLTSNPSSVERFRQEGRVASQISHPHCVFVLGADADVGRPYIVMELMPGQTLKDVVDLSGPLSVLAAVGRILDVIDGLGEAHRQGVIHRDVKPSNCFLTDDDRVKVGDFGLSKSLIADSAEQHLTSSGAFLGTVLYASPEQIRGEPVGYDSDVYAVCATLYFLLAGRAPYQHESITAALAKAVSEPPPPLRTRRPDVPRELERVILRGLDRMRDRRYQSVDDLRDALSHVRPDMQRPARVRNLCLAYLVDLFIVAFVGTLFGLLREVVAEFRMGLNQKGFDWLDFVGTVAYFGAFEGFLGWTPGKRLLRLRVARVGQCGPPGGLRGLLRAVTFPGLWAFGFAFADWPGDWHTGLLGPILGVTIALLALMYQLLPTPQGYRGLHDLASGCRVVQRPLPVPRMRLLSRFPNPLDLVQPSPVRLPVSVGGFEIAGKLCELPDGGEVWLAEDKSLGRRVLVRVYPAGHENPVGGESPVTRPTRLRVVGHGTIPWNSQVRAWVGYVAPAGVPLVDVVNPHRPLDWANTRPLLEQLAAELIVAEDDGNTVWRPVVEQVWVEPNGRLQVLDFPIPTGSRGNELTPLPMSGDPSAFVRHVASLALEGKPRHVAGRLRAPLSVSASQITDRLFGVDGRGYDRLEAFAKDLVDSHTHPTQVTGGMRAAQVSVQALLQGVGVITMVFLSGFFSFSMATGGALNQAHSTEELRDLLADPAAVEQIRGRAEQLRANDPETAERILAATATAEAPQSLRRIDALAARHRAESMTLRANLTRAERSMFDAYDRQRGNGRIYTGETYPLYAMSSHLQMSRNPQAHDLMPMRRPTAVVFAVMILLWPVVWIAFAFVFRGGLAFAVAGVALIRSDGRKAGRFRCAVRELVIWFPFTAMLLIDLWVQAAFPGMTATRIVLWALAIALLPIYAVIAVRYPTRPPQDRIMGTSLVPR